MIVASAMKLADGSVFVGKRHDDCYKNMISILSTTGKTYEEIKHIDDDCVQGFITDGLKFLTREEAFFEAGRNKQLKTEEGSAYLISEDIW